MGTILLHRGTGAPPSLNAGEPAIDLTAGASIMYFGDTTPTVTYAAQYIPGTTGLTFIHSSDVDVTLLSLPNITGTPLAFWDESLNAFAFSPGLVIGDGTNYAAFDDDGDLTFVGTAGLPYGELFAHDVDVDLTSATVNDWDQIVAFNTNHESNNTTPDHTSDHITIVKAGIYLATFTWTGHGPGAAHDWDFHLAKNDRAVTFNEVTAHIMTPVAQNLLSVSSSGILDLAVDDTVEMWVQRTSAGSNVVLTTTQCMITIVQVGGT